MKSIENKKLLKNLVVNKKAKSLIRYNLTKNVFIVDDNNDLSILFKKKQREDLEGTQQILKLKTLRHKRLKKMSINAYVANNLVPKPARKVTAYYNLLHTSKPFNIRMIKSIRGGYYFRSNHGIKGFMYRKEFLRAVKIFSFFEKLKLKTLAKICSLLTPKKTISSFNIGSVIKKADFFVPRIKISQKYFIAKYSGVLSVTFSPQFKVNNKRLLRLVKRRRLKKIRTYLANVINKRKKKLITGETKLVDKKRK